MRRAVAMLVLLGIVLVIFPVNAFGQTPTPTSTTSPGADDQVAQVDEEPPLEAQPTERFRFIAVGLMFLMLFVLGAAYMRSVMKGAENR